ncbi:MAG: isoleucine--tRNA ligase [Endomicrobium sp.]|jgi:isoleucyl-tRNA synthetase|nr:isoleucine--tRNA ligase [Endomicrobium sp.]
MNKKKDYSKTIILPKTDFQMKANLPQIEPFFVEKWNKSKIYYKLCKKNAKKRKFILHDGPPYANGHIHIGTSLNKILKDFVVKYRFMSGKCVSFIPGWDCHGLPIEQIVLKKLGASKNSVNRFIFRKQAHDFANKFIEIQKQEFKRLGIIADWEHSYLTFSPNYEKSIIKIFGELVRRGFIYRKRKPVYWCLTCETAMADAEVEYKNYVSDSIFVKFHILSLPKKFKMHESLFMNSSVLIWTTTPWTLPSNVALAFNEKSDYVVVVYKFQNSRIEKLVIAKDLLENIKNKIGAKNFDVLFKAKGIDFMNMGCQNPLINKKSRCVVSKFVDISTGTGIIHIAPGHGPEDYAIAVEHNLEIVSPINEKGLFTDEVAEFKDINIFASNTLIIDKLLNKKDILANAKLEHLYPHCWRCKKPVVFRATFQWFLSINHNNLRNKILKSVKNIKWLPVYGKNRITSMLKIRPDWCISRQRLWGVPIPVFYCKNCNEPFLNNKVINNVSLLFMKKGSGAWYEMTEEKLLKNTNAKCCLCKSTSFRKGEDILDVWFDSGVSYEAILANKNYKNLKFPADLYLEGSDQHRGWFQTSIILSTAIKGKSSYKNVLTHGFVVDGQGKKMSKSVNNVISSDQLIKKFGADVVRLWVASNDYKEDVKISNDIIKGSSDIYRKIRNTMRFLLGNIVDFKLKKYDLSFDRDVQSIDKYALNKLQQLILNTIVAYKKYEFHKVAIMINNFCTVFLSGFYLNVLKDTLYCDKKESIKRKSAQFTMIEICLTIVKLVSPILSFTAEEIWEKLKKLKFKLPYSVFLSNFPKINNKYILKPEVLKKWGEILYIRKNVFTIYEKLRKNKIIGSNIEASLDITYGQDFNYFFKDSEFVSLILENWDIKYKISNMNDDLTIKITKSTCKKCIRCWRYINNIKNDLCIRCLEAIK